MSIIHSHDRTDQPADKTRPRAYRLDMPWFMPRLLTGFASVIVGSALVIFLFAPTPEASTLTHRIIGESQFACTRESDRERATELSDEGQNEAAAKYREVAIQGGDCTLFQNGDVVIPESAGFFGPIKIRRQGDSQTYFVKRAAVS